MERPGEISIFDDHVLAALRDGGQAPSYVVANRLAAGKQRVRYRTPRILAALKRLEAAGRARRVSSAYATMHTFEALP